MENAVVIARPLWPVLRRAARLLEKEGYRVEEAASWSRLLDSGLPLGSLSGVFLGEHGDAEEEFRIVRRIREREGGQGVPIVLVGGMGMLLRAGKFLSCGVDVVFPADIPAEELVLRAKPLLRFGALCRSLAETNRELRDHSMRDGLTGLPNRRHFSEDLARNLEMARRIGRSLSCILVDIDDFKRVNDAFGHPQGDGVIRQFVAVLRSARRSYDTVARLGGDEFAWLLVDAGPDQALHAAQRMHRLVIDSPFEAGGNSVKLTATFGVSSYLPGAGSSPDLLVGDADRALYWAKESGKNSVRFYPPKPVDGDAATDSHIS